LAALENSGLLDAYTGNKADSSGSGVAGSGVGSGGGVLGNKPVSKKNKNQKKREAKQQQEESERQRKESEKVDEAEAAGEDEDEDGDVAESWEDVQDTETPDVPPPPEFVIDKDAVEERKRKEKQLQQQLERKQQQKDKKSQQQQNKGQETSAKAGGGGGSGGEKTKEEIVAEREAKKKAKQAARAAAAKEKAGGQEKSSDQQQSNESKPAEKVAEDNNSSQQQMASAAAAPVQGGGAGEANNNSSKKTKEEIVAEREAKKKAKQAARANAKANAETADNQQSNVSHSDNKPAPPAADQASSGSQEPANGAQKSKAERRAKQEAQRAAKAAAQAEAKADKQGETTKAAAAADKAAAPAAKKAASAEKANKKADGGSVATTKSHQRVPDDIQADRISVEKKMQKSLASQNLPQRPKATGKVMLFSHLHQYERELSISKDLPVVNSHIHPAIVQLGLAYAEGTIQGSNARCLAFMNAIKRVIIDHVTPEDRQFSRDLDAKLKTVITFLKGCRNHSVSMGNAIRFLKAKIRKIESDVDEANAKQSLIDSIDNFNEEVRLSAVQISMTACEKIRDGDVILTYGCSSLLKSVFVGAAESGLKFRVIVADGRPKFEGREMARHLVNAGVHCTYTMVHSLSYVIGEVSKVFLGAHAVLANGYVMSRVGTSQVAMIAKAQNVPVLVCCETYKFSERVQTDSFVFNELGDPDDLVATGKAAKDNPLEDWRDLSSLNLLYLNYDVTPASLVDAIISEISVIPCTSVPVVLRLKALDLGQ